VLGQGRVQRVRGSSTRAAGQVVRLWTKGTGRPKVSSSDSGGSLCPRVSVRAWSARPAPRSLLASCLREHPRSRRTTCTRSRRSAASCQSARLDIPPSEDGRAVTGSHSRATLAPHCRPRVKPQCSHLNYPPWLCAPGVRYRRSRSDCTNPPPLAVARRARFFGRGSFARLV
jgi:hypothetical protein